MTSRLWIYLALITLVAAVGAIHTVERVTAPVQIGVLFK